MSKPRYRWWGYIKNVIRAYPSLKQEYEALHEQSITPSMSGMPGSGNNKGLEDIVARELPKEEQREYEAVKKAINGTLRLNTGNDRMKVIDFVYWKRHKLKDAAWKCHMSYDTAQNYSREFIILVAYHKDLIGYDELRKAYERGKSLP